MLSIAAVVASAVASVSGTYLPTTPPIAPPRGYQTPPVPPVAMLKESFCCLDCAPTPAAIPSETARASAADATARVLLVFMIHLLRWNERLSLHNAWAPLSRTCPRAVRRWRSIIRPPATGAARPAMDQAMGEIIMAKATRISNARSEMEIRLRRYPTSPRETKNSEPTLVAAARRKSGPFPPTIRRLCPAAVVEKKNGTRKAGKEYF